MEKGIILIGLPFTLESIQSFNLNLRRGNPVPFFPHISDPVYGIRDFSKKVTI
jgi:hypothetical protein